MVFKVSWKHYNLRELSREQMMKLHKRKKYIINPTFQIKMSAYVCLFVLIASIFYPMFIWDIYERFTQVILQYDSILYQSLQDEKMSILKMLIFWQLIIIFFAFLTCMFISHRIAGPMYKLKKFLRAIPDMKTFEKIHFRKGDYFREVAEVCNDTFIRIRDNYKNDFVYLDEVEKYMDTLRTDLSQDKQKIIDEIKDRLSTIQNRFVEK